MNHEEKILEMLEHLTQTVEKQSGILEKHGEMLEKHGEMLEKQGEMLEKQGEMLKKQGETLEKHGELLEKHERTLEKLQLDVSGIKVRLDVEVKTQFNLLAEGQQTIIETMTPKDRVDELEADVIILKTAVRMLSQEVAELQKAQ